MSAIVLDGKALAQTLERDLQRRISHLLRPPVLALILIGENTTSIKYVKKKEEACRRIRMILRREFLPSESTNTAVLKKIETLNSDQAIDGILLQYPVPPQIDEHLCFDQISPKKDIDGVGNSESALNKPSYDSAVPSGILRMLKYYQIPLKKKHTVVIGNSQLLGKPMATMLLRENATVTVCHAKTKNLSGYVRQADIVVGAIGIPGFIKADWIKEGAVVINANYHPEEGIGDIELSSVIEKCSAYNPVPGSVGPMTIITLLEHTVTAAEKSQEVPRS